MKREQVQDILEYVSNSYPGKFQFPTGTPARDGSLIGTWHDMLKHYSPDVVRQAVVTYVRSGAEWPPSLGQLIGQIRKIIEPEAISGGQAWQMVIRSIHKYGAFYGADKIKAELPPEVWNTVMLFGLENIANSSNEDTYMMSMFIKQHDLHVERQRERDLLNPVRRDLLA